MFGSRHYSTRNNEIESSVGAAVWSVEEGEPRRMAACDASDTNMRDSRGIVLSFGCFLLPRVICY